MAAAGSVGAYGTLDSGAMTLHPSALPFFVPRPSILLPPCLFSFLSSWVTSFFLLPSFTACGYHAFGKRRVDVAVLRNVIAMSVGKCVILPTPVN